MLSADRANGYAHRLMLQCWVCLLSLCLSDTAIEIEAWGPIYKESYARLMTAQDLRRTYAAELVNCEWLTKNHTLNLLKIYAKLRKNLWPHKCCHNSIIRENYVILVYLLTLDHFHHLLIKQEDHRIKPMTHLKVFCRNIFERDLSDASKAPTHLRKFLLSKVSFTNRT